MMGNAMMRSADPSPLGSRLRKVLAWVLLPGLALCITLGCGPATSTGTVPTITGVSPLIGLYTAPVVITGSGFTNGLQNFYFGNAGVTAGTVNSDTQATVDVPAAAITGQVSVYTTGGSASYISEFIVIPSVSAVTTIPASAPLAPAGPITTPVTITGYGLMGISTMTISGTGGPIPLTTTTTTTPNQITFNIPTGAVTGNITLSNGYASVLAPTILIPFNVS